MKSALCLLLVSFLLMSCEGPEGQQGLVGPPGEQGEPGETGATIILLTGRITNNSYLDNGDFAVADDAKVNVNDVIQVYVSDEPDAETWLFYPTFLVESGKVMMYDPDHDLLSWYYLILIIKN
ncbi:hypothetical protein ES703_36248 [subsurface metagenome]